jgi:hypothetical protein
MTIIILYLFQIPIHIVTVYTFSEILKFQVIFHLVKSNINYQLKKYMTIIAIFVLIVNILINFNTGYFDKGVIIYERISIAKNYIRNYFIQDLLSTIPFTIYIIITEIVWENKKVHFYEKAVLILFYLKLQ